jgi:hypothetical protein
MIRRPEPLVLLMLLTAAPALHAEQEPAAAPRTGGSAVYRTTDEHGNVVFTDDPAGRPAEVVDLPDLTIVPSTPLPASGGGVSSGAGDRDDEDVPVASTVILLSPSVEETVRSNTGSVPVRARVDAPLRVGDVFEVILDGRIMARNAGGTFELTEIDRGAHQVFVRLLDRRGATVATSPTHTFYLHRRSARHP